jgi:hypothetical protein
MMLFEVRVYTHGLSHEGRFCGRRGSSGPGVAPALGAAFLLEQ